jgi:hypothetical protein
LTSGERMIEETSKQETTKQENLLCPKAGTATSSPTVSPASPPFNIVNLMLWIKQNAYEETTMRATAKRLKHLQKNCDLSNPEEVKAFVANKKNPKMTVDINSYAVS